MATPDYRDPLMTFLSTPSRETYLAAREAIVLSEIYDPAADDLEDLEALVDAGKFSEVEADIQKRMPTMLLSPSLHLLLSAIGRRSGDEKGARMESFIADTYVRGVASTGNGSRQNPYLVVTVSDEYDVLSFLGKQPTGQHLVHEGPRHFDVIICADGQELWFDVTASFEASARRLIDGRMRRD